MTLAYHFVGATRRDGRPVPPDGEWLVHEGEVIMCAAGLHASRRPFDALRYAPGETLCLVGCEGILDEDTDKFVCRRRRIVRRIDATRMLREFARICALSVIHLWNAPLVVRQYLETGDESLRDVALAAAPDVEWAAARASASWAAARDAAWAVSNVVRLRESDGDAGVYAAKFDTMARAALGEGER